MSQLDLDTLERLAREAKGGWYLWEPEDYGPGNESSKRNQVFIAASNPAVVLSLIERIRAQQRALEAIQSLVKAQGSNINDSRINGIIDAVSAAPRHSREG